MFNQIIYDKPNAQKKQLTCQEKHEILGGLNQGRFFERKELTNKKIMPMLDQVMQIHLNCHDVTRELAKMIQNLNWQRCPGYLVERSVNINNLSKNYAFLKHHSVIEDVQNQIFYECLLIIYPLEKYLFIPHDSSLKGWDIKVF